MDPSIATALVSSVVAAGAAAAVAWRARGVRTERETERRLREIAESFPTGVVAADLEGRIVWASSAFEKLAGAAPGQLVGVSTHELYEDGAEEEAESAALPAGRGLASGRVRRHLRTLTGDTALVESRWAYERDAGGNPVGFIAAVTDLSDQIEVARQLEATRRFSDRVAELSPLTMWVADVERQRLMYVSPQIESQLGYTPTEILEMGSDVRLLLHPEEIAEPLGPEAAVADFRFDGLLEREYRVRHKNGDWRRFQVLSSVFERDDDGDPVQILGVVQDVTESRRQASALRQSEALLRQIIDATPAMIYVKDLDGRFVLVNSRFERVAGLERGSAVGLRDSEIFGEELARSFRQHDARVLESRTAHIVEETPPAGTVPRTYMTVKFPLLDEAGEPWALCGVSTDISDRKRAEVERERLVEKVQHAQKLESLGVLAGGIAHDFNNLLLAILGNAGLARQEVAPDSPLQDELADIEGAAERAAELCRQLLAFSGKGRFVMRPLDLNARIREVVLLLDVSLVHHAQVHLDLARDLPVVEADATQIDQVLTNLLTNAFDAMDDDLGLVSVETACVELDAETLRDFPDARLGVGSHVRVRVRDTGCGMKSELVSRIFDPFFTTKFTGRGLGLAAVQGIVAGHRGAIRVASELGRGTLFEILLPGMERVPAVEPDDGAGVGWTGSGIVLVVDDEESVRSLARRILERLGFTVWTAADGEEALRVFGRRAAEVTAVLLDATMPVLSGEETLRGLRAIREDVPILLSSGYTGNQGDAREDGATAFLQKPYRPADLADALRRALF